MIIFHFEDLKIIKVEKLDGFKFIFNEDECYDKTLWN